MAFTYLLECSDGTYYAGSTRDLDARLMQHASGRGGAYTSKRLPVRLVWLGEFERVDEAYAFEKRLQGWGRAKREALIRGEFKSLPALSKKRDWEGHRQRAAERAERATEDADNSPAE